MAGPGQSIGPYQLDQQLGAGGMGEVYRALDTRVGRHVALKILPDSLAADEERQRRFQQEARLAAALNHPNVMAIYDVGLDQHPPYIVAELVPGESLRQIIERGPIAPRRAVDIAAQVAAGLAAAHAAGIVHRDLKPENVMVTPDGTVKVLDFGVAREQSKPAAANETRTMAHTMAGAVVGTASYMSPEQARAEEVDHRSDQFSLGLLLYEMLSGKQAFARPSAIQTMSAIVEAEPPSLDRPVPAQLRWVLERCLAKDRSRRYESTRDLARELAQLRDHFGELSTATGTQTLAATRRRTSIVWIPASMLAGAIIAWCAAALLRDSSAVDLTRYKLTPFATAQTIQTYSAWSPDGKSIAFLGWDAAGRWQLFVQAVNAPTAVQVTAADARVNTGSPPFWSPDSRSLYFRCSTDTQNGICRIPASGGARALIQPNVQAAAISPDGKTLAMWPAMMDAQGASVWIATPPEAPRQRYAPMPFDAKQFYGNPAIRFSPDGKTILLFVALDSRGETAWLLPWPPASASPAFTKGIPFSNTPQFSWIPDGRNIVFADIRPGEQYTLYLGEVKSGKHWPILAEDRFATLPTLSPDGSRIAYTSALSHTDIVEVPLGDGQVKTVLGSSRSEERVDASRVAQQLVYVTDRRGVPEIWIKSLAEGWERPLVTPSDVQADGDLARSFLNPVFSPDGRRVAFAARDRSGSHIYTVFTSGGTPVRATSSNDLELCATWSPDGNWLAYSALVGPVPSLLKVRPGSGEAPQTIGRAYGIAAPVWSPTGEWIADHVNGQLVLVSPDGKSQRLSLGDEGPVAWSHDGKTLYQVRADPPVLVAIDVATGKNRKLRDLPDLAPYSNGNPGWSAALTSDQKNIVYAVNRPRSEIWILDGVQGPRPWYRRLLP